MAGRGPHLRGRLFTGVRSRRSASTYDRPVPEGHPGRNPDGGRCGRLGRPSSATIFLLFVCCLIAGCTSGSAAESPTTPTAYVATGASVANPGDTVAVVDTVTSKVQTPITTGTLPAALAVTPDGKDLLVANKGDDTVSSVDVASGKVVKTATVGLEPDAVAVTPNGALALVANFGDNTVTPLALPSLRIEPAIAVGRQPVAIAVSPTGTLALVSDYEDGTVTPISLPALKAGVPVGVGAEPVALYITPDGGTALVANFQTSTVTPLSLPALVPAAPIAVAGNPTGIAGSSATRAFVSGGDSITPIALPSRQPGAPIAVGVPAEALAVAPGGATAWVCGVDGTLIHVDLNSAAVIGQVTVGNQPSAVVIAVSRPTSP